MSTESSYTIRAVRDEERATARALTLAAYGEYAEQMEPSAWAALREAITAALAGAGPVEHLVAERAGEVVGSVMLFPPSTGDTGSAGGRMRWPELRLLAVTPEDRGHGVGAALVRACVERARAAGAPALGLYTSNSMRSAIALYERLGFARVPEHDFRPPGAELVKAYKLELEGGSQ